MTRFGLYEPGSSVVHRAPPGPKFLVLLVFAATTFVIGSPVWLGVCLAVVGIGFAVARISLGSVLRLARALLLVAVVAVAVQLWLVGHREAVALGLRLVAALASATLFTLTTRVEDLVSAVERGLRPLRRFGVRPELVGLFVGLTIAAIGSLSDIAASVREAALARGAGRSVTAFAVPFLIRTMRHSDELGEALAARGVGDQESR
ncbi:energy-coupling factor transporter transmembrane component T family protein [Pseudonocardia spinosispora]|uniref:energy-coupling factor transporter transmembrane component T family protein n=1 Tax=Pseudonocardia spinosispora TaxID=103441 RepID=UPI000417F235|nr:energy-coupling factor transporter transmembrane component T [Pseudonocardia spinosispora]